MKYREKTQGERERKEGGTEVESTEGEREWKRET